MATPRQVLDLLGIEYFERNNRLMMLCPFHDDTDPSSGFYEDTELWHCFACSFTFDPTKFYAQYQGIPYNQAEADLERRFGERRVATAQVNRTKNLVERAKAEKVLAPLKEKLSAQQFCPIGERLDKALLRHIRGAHTDEELDTNLEMWYNIVQEAINGPEHFDPNGASGASLDARLEERVAEFPGAGRSFGEVDLD